jgi:myosin heavy subunit
LQASLQHHMALSSQHQSTLKMELVEHHNLELQRMKDQHEAELVEAARAAAQQTERFHRFKDATQGQMESLRQQLEESQRQLKEVHEALSASRAMSNTLTQEVRNERLQNERLVSDRDQVIPELEKRLIHLQGQVDEAHQLRSKLKYRDELYKVLEDELLEALDHIEVLEEFESTEIRERDEALRTMTEKNESLQSQLEEAVLLAEQSTGQLVVAHTSVAELSRLKESVSRLLAFTKNLLQSRLSSKDSKTLDDLGHAPPDRIDATSIVAIIERFEEIHAQLLLDEALGEGLSSQDEVGSFVSTSASRRSNLTSAAPITKGRWNQHHRVPSISSHIETPSQKSHTAQTDSASISKPHRTTVLGTPQQVSNENARNGPSTSARRLSVADSSRGSSLKAPTVHVSKLTRPQPGKQRSLLQKYGSRSVLQEPSRALPAARRGIPSSTSIPSDRKVTSSRSILASHAKPATTHGLDGESLEWTDVGRPIDSSKDSSWGHLSDTSARVTTVSEEASALGWSNVGRSGNELLDGIQSQSSLKVNTGFDENSSGERQRSTMEKSPIQEPARISPKVLLRNVVKSLTSRSPSNATDRSMESEAPLPAEAIDGTPHESHVEAKFESLFAGWSCSKMPSEVFSPTCMLPASLQFSTAKKPKREGSGLAFAVPDFHAAVTRVPAAPPSSKRLKLDEIQASGIHDGHCTTGSAGVPEIIERELAASLTPEESLLSPFPARNAQASKRTSPTKSRTTSNLSTASTTAREEEPTKIPSGGQQPELAQESATQISTEKVASTEQSGTDSFGTCSFSRCDTSSASLIARTYRTYKTRAGFLRQRNSIVLVQAVFRGFAARSKSQRLNQVAREIEFSASAIQTTWRRSYHQRKYLGTIRAACILQSVGRTFLVRRRTFQMTRSVSTLQAFARRALDAKRRRIFAAVVLQRAWRCLAARTSHKGVLRKIVLVQAIFRGARTRQQIHVSMESERVSSTQIQACWRSYKDRKDYKVTQASVLILQTCVRHLVARKKRRHTQSLHEKMLLAVSTIQKSWRSYSSRQSLICTMRMAVLLQALFRGFVMRQRLKAKAALESATSTIIQASWRRYGDRKRYRRARTAIVLVQAGFRAYLAHCKLKRLKDLHVQAAVAIQRSWRSSTAQRTYVHVVCTILILQSFFRGCSARLHLKRRIIKENATCTKIQAAWRRHVGRVEYSKSRKSAMLVQAVVRATMTKRKIARLQESRAQAALTIQSSWRGCIAQRTFRQAVSTAVEFQSLFRAYSTRKRFLESKIIRQKACIRIQAAWKCHKSRQAFVLSKLSIIRIQTGVRVYLAKSTSKQIQHTLAQELIAARCIQTSWRCSAARNAFVVARSNAQLIQTVARGYCARRCFQERRQRLASTRIQASWKCCNARKKYDVTRMSILRLQSFARCALAKSRRQNLLAEVVSAAVIIQSFSRRIFAQVKYVNTLRKIVLLQSLIRGISCRRRLNLAKACHKATTRIQCTWKARSMRIRYLRYLHGMVRAQSLFRGRAVRAKEQRRKRETAALVLQRAWRRWTLTKVYVAYVSSSILIQAISRGCIARRRLSRLREQRCELAACVRIQAEWRAGVKRNRFNEMKSAAVVIKNYLRRCTETRRTIVQHISAEKLQALVRGFIQRSVFQEMRRSAIQLQAFVRMLRAQNVANSLRIEAWAVVTIQSAFRRCMFRQHLSTKRRAVVVIQRTFRGYCTYRRCLAIRLAALEKSRVNALAESDIKCREDQHGAGGSSRPSRRSTRSIDVGVQCAAIEVTERKPLGNVEATVKQSNGQTKVMATRRRVQPKLSVPSLDESTPREEVEKLKVQELRDILRHLGIESKVYRNLRKADLVTLVLDEHQMNATTAND